MLLMRTAAVLLLVVAGLCLAAEEEEPPPTGTIEVEVVYKDTGEPVTGVLVALDTYREHDLVGTSLRLLNGEGAGSEGKCTFGSLSDGTYKVLILNALSVGRSTRFYYAGSDVEKTITLTGDTSRTRVLFQVERGAHLRGSIVRTDGLPVAGAWAVVGKGEDPRAYAYGIADEDGRFEVLGIAPGPIAHVQVFSPIECEGEVVGFIPMCEAEVELEETAAQADFVLATAPLQVTLDVVKPAWPLSSFREEANHAFLIWVGGKPQGEAKSSDVRVFLGRLPCETLPGFPRQRYTLHIKDAPAERTLTVGLGTWSLGGAFGVALPPHATIADELRYRCWQTMDMTRAPQETHLVLYEQYARLSRVLWFAVPLFVVLAVCVPVLVWQMRKRRGPAATQGE